MTTYNEYTIQAVKFPQKLWKIVNDCETGAIQWSHSGNSILLEYNKFQKEYLTLNTSIFKTTNITSFIRQLNLYGFRKVTSHRRDPICNSHNPNMHEFLHEYFRIDRPDLLKKVCRKINTTTKSIQKQNHSFKNPNKCDIPSSERGMTKLQICQNALKKALEQALHQYKQDKFIRLMEDIANFSPEDAESSQDTILTLIEMKSPEDVEEESSSEFGTQESNDDVIYKLSGYKFLVPINESTQRFNPYFVNRNEYTLSDEI